MSYIRGEGVYFYAVFLNRGKFLINSFWTTEQVFFSFCFCAGKWWKQAWSPVKVLQQLLFLSFVADWTIFKHCLSGDGWFCCWDEKKTKATNLHCLHDSDGLRSLAVMTSHRTRAEKYLRLLQIHLTQKWLSICSNLHWRKSRCYWVIFCPVWKRHIRAAE